MTVLSELLQHQFARMREALGPCRWDTTRPSEQMMYRTETTILLFAFYASGNPNVSAGACDLVERWEAFANVMHIHLRKVDGASAGFVREPHRARLEEHLATLQRFAQPFEHNMGFFGLMQRLLWVEGAAFDLCRALREASALDVGADPDGEPELMSQVITQACAEIESLVKTRTRLKCKDEFDYFCNYWIKVHSKDKDTPAPATHQAQRALRKVKTFAVVLKFVLRDGVKVKADEDYELLDSARMLLRGIDVRTDERFLSEAHRSNASSPFNVAQRRARVAQLIDDR